MFETNPQTNKATLVWVRRWIRSLVEWIHPLPSFHPTFQQCCVVQSLTSPPPPSQQYPYEYGTSRSILCACRLSRTTKLDCSRHPPWVSQSRAPAPESAATGAWLLHHGSRLRNASRSGVHDSAVAFPFITSLHLFKSEQMSLCRTG